MSTSPGHRVAHIFELLENILLQLDHCNPKSLQALLLCQRTSRSFRETILNSKPLQARLCLSPLPQRKSYSDGTENLLLRNRSIRSRLADGAEVDLKLNAVAISRSYRTRRPDVSVSLSTKPSEEDCLASRPCADASWRRMYLCTVEHKIGMVTHPRSGRAEYYGEQDFMPSLGELVDGFFASTSLSSGG